MSRVGRWSALFGLALVGAGAGPAAATPGADGPAGVPTGPAPAVEVREGGDVPRRCLGWAPEGERVYVIEQRYEGDHLTERSGRVRLLEVDVTRQRVKVVRRIADEADARSWPAPHADGYADDRAMLRLVRAVPWLNAFIARRGLTACTAAEEAAPWAWLEWPRGRPLVAAAMGAVARRGWESPETLDAAAPLLGVLLAARRPAALLTLIERTSRDPREVVDLEGIALEVERLAALARALGGAKDRELRAQLRADWARVADLVRAQVAEAAEQDDARDVDDTAVLAWRVVEVHGELRLGGRPAKAVGVAERATRPGAAEEVAVAAARAWEALGDTKRSEAALAAVQQPEGRLEVRLAAVQRRMRRGDAKRAAAAVAALEGELSALAGRADPPLEELAAGWLEAGLSRARLGDPEAARAALARAGASDESATLLARLAAEPPHEVTLPASVERSALLAAAQEGPPQLSERLETLLAEALAARGDDEAALQIAEEGARDSLPLRIAAQLLARGHRPSAALLKELDDL